MSNGDSPIYDRADAIARLEGDEALFAEMAKMFEAECESYCEALKTALDSGDAATLRREAHTMKSLLATFSFEDGRALALELEEMGARGDLDGARELTGRVLAAARALAKNLAES